MHATCSQADQFAGDNAEHAHGYYFFLPKKPKKQKQRAFQPDTLYAFGPYRSSYEASFIRTSARAWGLLDADARF